MFLFLYLCVCEYSFEKIIKERKIMSSFDNLSLINIHESDE